MSECFICEELTRIFLESNPSRRGEIICAQCVEKMGLIPLFLEFDAHQFYKDLKQNKKRIDERVD